MKKKITLIVTVILIIVLSIIPCYADSVSPNKPASNTAATTFTTGLVLSDLQEIVETLYTQIAFANIYPYPTRGLTVMAIYQMQTASGYQYYAALLAPNVYGNSNATVVSSADFKLTFGGSTYFLRYKFIDDNATGWTYDGYLSGEIESVGWIYYRSSTTTYGNIFDYTNTGGSMVIGTDLLTGNACLRWQKAAEAFDSMSNGGGTGTEGTYEEGFRDGKNDVLNHLSEYGLVNETAYYAYGASEFTRGKNYVKNHPDEFQLVTLTQYQTDVADAELNGYNQGLLDADGQAVNVAAMMKEILQSPMRLFNGIAENANFENVLGIDVVGLVVTVLMIAVIITAIVLIKKVK